MEITILLENTEHLSTIDISLLKVIRTGCFDKESLTGLINIILNTDDWIKSLDEWLEREKKNFPKTYDDITFGKDLKGRILDWIVYGPIIWVPILYKLIRMYANYKKDKDDENKDFDSDDSSEPIYSDALYIREEDVTYELPPSVDSPIIH